jgi:hypothetical protein
MAVPDWPTTYGYNMFFFPISKWTGGIFYEHSHRLVGVRVGLLTTILAVWLWSKESRAWMRWLGVDRLFRGCTARRVGRTARGVVQGPDWNFSRDAGAVFFALVSAIALFTSRCGFAIPLTLTSRRSDARGEPRPAGTRNYGGCFCSHLRDLPAIDLGRNDAASARGTGDS